MVIMASGIARGRVRTTTTESRNMAARLQKIGWQRHTALVYLVLLWYSTSLLWSNDTCQNKLSADQYHVTISRAQVCSSSRSRVFVKLAADQVGFPIGSRAHVLVNLLKTGQDCSGADYGLTGNRIITFFFYKNVFFCFVLSIWRWLKLKTEGRRKTSKSKFYLFLG